MEYNIRPLSFAETFDRSFRVLADNAVVLIGIAVIIGIPENAVKGPGPGTWYQIVLLLFALAVGPLVQAALTWAIADTYLGKPVTICDSLKICMVNNSPFFRNFLAHLRDVRIGRWLGCFICAVLQRLGLHRPSGVPRCGTAICLSDGSMVVSRTLYA